MKDHHPAADKGAEHSPADAFLALRADLEKPAPIARV